MNIANALIFLGGLIFLAHLFNVLFEYTKIPSVLLLITIGIIIGPLTSLANPSDLGSFGNVFTTITLIVILFESSIGLRITDLRSTIGSATLVTVTNFILSTAAVTIVLLLCTEFNFFSALFLGFTLGGTSSAVVIPMMKQLKLSDKAQTILFIEAALSGVLCLMLGLSILQGIESNGVSITSILLNIVMSLTLSTLFGIIMGFVWSYILQTVLIRMKNVMFTSFALAFIIYGMCELLGINGGIGVLAFGIVLGNLEYYADKKFIKQIFNQHAVGISLTDRNFFSEIGFILQTYFFVYVGMSLRFGNIKILALGAVLTFVVFALRFLVNHLLIGKDISSFDRHIMGLMTPKGLVAAVLASIPLQMNLPYGNEIQDIAYAVIFFSIILCSLMVIVEKSIERRETNSRLSKESPHISEEVQMSNSPHTEPTELGK